MKKIFQNIPLFYSKFIWKNGDSQPSTPEETDFDAGKGKDKDLPPIDVESLNFVLGAGTVRDWFNGKAMDVLKEGGDLDRMIKETVHEVVIKETKELRERVVIVEKENKKLIEIVKRQGGQISKQAEQIKKQQKMLEDQTKLIDELTKGQNALRIDHDDLEKNHLAMKATQDTIQIEHRNLKKEQSALGIGHDELEKKQTGLRTEHDALKSDNESTKTRTSAVESKQRELAKEFAKIQAKVAKLKDNTEVTDEIKTKIAELEDVMGDDRNITLRGLKALEVRIDEIKSETERIDKMEDEISDLDGVQREQKSALDQHGARLEQGETERAEMKQRTRDLEVELIDLDFSNDINAIREQINGFDDEIAKLAQANENLSNKFDGLFEATKRRLDELSDKLEKYNERLTKIEELTDQLEKVEQLALKIRENDRRIAILESKEDGTDAFKLQFAKLQQKLEGVDFADLEAIPGLKDRIAKLHENIEAINELLEDVDFDDIKSIPGLEEKIERAEKERMELSDRANHADLEIDRAETERLEISDRVNHLQLKLENLDLSQGLKPVIEQIKALEEEMKQLNGRMDGFNGTSKSIEKTFNEQMDRIKKLEELAANLEKIDQLTKEVKELNKKTSLNGSRIRNNLNLIERDKVILNELGNAWAELQLQLKDVDFDDIKSIPGMQEAIGKANAEQVKMKGHMILLIKSIKKMRTRIEELDFSDDISELKENAEKIEAEISKLTQKNEDLGNKFDGLFKELSDKLEVYKERLEAIELLKDKLDKIDELEKQIGNNKKLSEKAIALSTKLDIELKEVQKILKTLPLDQIKAIPGIQARLNKAEIKLAKLDPEAIKEMGIRLTAVEQAISELIDTIVDPEEINALKAAISKLQEANIGQNIYNTKISTSIKILQVELTEVSKIETRLTILEDNFKTSVRKLQESIARGEKNTQDLETDVNQHVANLEDYMDSLKKQMNMIVEAFKGLKKDNAQVTIVINRFKQTIHNIELKLDKLTKVKKTQTTIISNMQGSGDREGSSANKTTKKSRQKTLYNGPKPKRK